MRARKAGLAAGRTPPVVALVAAAAATCLLGCGSKTGRRGPPAAASGQPDVPALHAEEQADDVAAGGEAEPASPGFEDDTAAVEDVHVPEHVATLEPEPETVSVVEERPSERPESRLGRATREEGRVPGPGTAGDEDAIRAAKRLAPQRRGDWCVKGPAAFPELVGKLIMGTGSVSGVRHPALARQAASARARGGVAKTLRTSATNVLKGYLERSAGLQAAERGMLIETAVKNVFRRVVVSAEIVDSFRDEGYDTWYALAALRTDLVKAAVRRQMGRLAASLGQPLDRITEAKLQELLQDAFGPEVSAAPEPFVRGIQPPSAEPRGGGPVPAHLPEWVLRGGKAFPEDIGKAIYGVGSLSGVTKSDVMNVALARARTQAQARQRVADTLKAFVAAVAREYLRSVIAGEISEAELGQIIEIAQKNVTRTTLVGCHIVEMYYNLKSDTWYSLAKLEMDSVAMELRKQMSRVERTRKLRIPAANAHRELDRIIEAKLRELLQDAFGPEPAAPTPEDVF